MRKMYVLILLGFWITGLEAQEIKFGGQFFLRSEIDGRDFNSQTPPNGYSLLKSRFQIEKQFNKNDVWFIQIQDSRLLGSESSLTSNEKNTDIHQVFVTFGVTDSIPLLIQAGRFEMSYRNNRLLGPANWNPVGRSFDGVRFLYNNDGVKFDLFAVTIKDNQNSFFTKPAASKTSVQSVRDLGSDLYGGWATSTIFSGEYDLFLYYESDRDTTGNVSCKKDSFTAGFNAFYKIGDNTILAEQAWQLGKLNDQNLSAWMFCFQIQNRKLIQSVNLTAGVDLLSGTNSGSSSNNTFLTNFGDNHRYYGNMDFFPAMNLTAGLIDVYFKTMIWLQPEVIELITDYHYFRTMKSVSNKNSLGYEIDSKLNWNISGQIKIISGLSVFYQNDMMISSSNSDTYSYWGFIGIQSNF